MFRLFLQISTNLVDFLRKCCNSFWHYT